jgi:hypothetical protein
MNKRINNFLIIQTYLGIKILIPFFITKFAVSNFYECVLNQQGRKK